MPEISSRLAGRTIVGVWKSTEKDRVVIECEDGYEVHIGWADEKGNPVKGEPVPLFCGVHVRAKTATLFGKGIRR